MLGRVHIQYLYMYCTCIYMYMYITELVDSLSLCRDETDGPMA